jgi:hypothetical protein
MFSTKGKFGKTPSPYLSYGSSQELTINDIRFQKFSSGSKAAKIVFDMESAPINDPAFKPVEGHAGRVGQVVAAPYVTSDKDLHEFVSKVIAPIADAMGVRDRLDQIEATDFEDYLSKVREVFLGNFARFFISAKEYQSPTIPGKMKYSLLLPKFGFVESLKVSDSKMQLFDKSNKYHYKKYVDPSITDNEKVSSVKSEVKNLADDSDDESEDGFPF